jgi:hypothetical protein
MLGTMTNIKTHHGSCICGFVQFEVSVDASKATMCNCSVCQKLGARSINGKPEMLRVLSDESKHGRYGSDYAARYFCPRCGTYCYGKGNIPEIGGPFASVNINTLDDLDPNEAALTHWDGRHDNWEAGMRPAPWPVFREGEARVRTRPVTP